MATFSQGFSNEATDLTPKHKEHLLKAREELNEITTGNVRLNASTARYTEIEKLIGAIEHLLGWE